VTAVASRQTNDRAYTQLPIADCRLPSYLRAMSDPLDSIRSMIGAHDIVLFMKGAAEQPQCGFSQMVVRILDHMGVDYHDVNVLADENIRQGVKEFSNWPTIPQLYVKGEFVGGCDIVREMFQTGELKALFDEKGVAVPA
jgi:monothiol glutaredoxin